MAEKNLDENKILLELLAQKQVKQGISYCKTSDPVYKTFYAIYFLAFLICSFINLLYFVSTLSDMSVKLANKTTIINDIQASEISEIKNSLIAVGVMGIAMIVSFILGRLKRPLPQFITGAFSAVILLITYITRLTTNIGAGDYTALFWRHLLPLAVFTVSLTVCCVIAMRQKHIETKGCQEIAEAIYRRYSISATNVDQTQWQQMLEDYALEAAEKKQRKKAKKKRDKKAGDETKAAE